MPPLFNLDTPENIREFALCAEVEGTMCTGLHNVAENLSSQDWERAVTINRICGGRAENNLNACLFRQPLEIQRMFWYLYSLMLEDGAL